MDRTEFMDIVYDLLKDDPDNNRANEIIEAADEYVEDAVKEALEGKDTNVPSKWIPVSERMPDNTDTVLIVHKGGVSTGWYNGRYWERVASSNHRMLKTVTHWMPFPKAPKGE